MNRLITLTPLLLLMFFSVSVHAQHDTGTPITVKDDSDFSGKRKVELAPQRIAPTLTMSITAEIDTRTKGNSFRDLGTALVNFISTTGRREYGAGDNIEFNFLVDGQRIRGGRIKSSPLTDKLEKDGKELALGVISNGALEDIGKGRDVKLKIGEQIFTLDKAVIQNLAAVFRELAK
jgi:hypothetical protein